MARRRKRWLTHCSWHNKPWCRKERSLVRRTVCRKRQYSKSICPQFDNSLPPFPTRLCTYKRGCLVSVVTQWIMVPGTLLRGIRRRRCLCRWYKYGFTKSRKIHLERRCHRVTLICVARIPMYHIDHESPINKKIEEDMHTTTPSDSATTFVILNYSANRRYLICHHWCIICLSSLQYQSTPCFWLHYQKTQILERNSNFTAKPQILLTDRIAW